MRNNKLHLLILIVLLISILFISCSNKDDDGVPSYFLEPDGYIICSISVSRGIVDSGYYGYISESDLGLFTSHDIDILKVLHPYEEGKFALVDVSKIIGIYIGKYKDIR